VALSLVIIIFHLFLNELIEVDKVGSLFLVGLAVLIRAGSWLEEPASSSSSMPQL
jgi:O-antigen ligase